MEEPISLPTGVTSSRAERTLTITWEDAEPSVIPWHVLRWSCPCALCQGEFGTPGALATVTSLPPAETELVDLALVGTYAIQPVWASGHTHGIFTWEYLRELGDAVRNGAVHVPQKGAGEHSGESR
jgi:DUF971 family protein